MTAADFRRRTSLSTATIPQCRAKSTSGLPVSCFAPVHRRSANGLAAATSARSSRRSGAAARDSSSGRRDGSCYLRRVPRIGDPSTGCGRHGGSRSPRASGTAPSQVLAMRHVRASRADPARQRAPVDPATTARAGASSSATASSPMSWGAAPEAPRRRSSTAPGSLAPASIDLRAFVGEPGAEHRETLKSASEAAAAGGVTTLVCMPDTNPPIDDPAIVDFVLRRARDTAIVNIRPAAALTKGLAGPRDDRDRPPRRGRRGRLHGRRALGRQRAGDAPRAHLCARFRRADHAPRRGSGPRRRRRHERGRARRAASACSASRARPRP